MPADVCASDGGADVAECEQQGVADEDACMVVMVVAEGGGGGRCLFASGGEGGGCGERGEELLEV